MSNHATRFDAEKSSSTLLVLFIPSHDRFGTRIDQDYWLNQALEVLGQCFGGATAFPQGRGVWRDDSQGGKLLFDEPFIIQCYTSETAIEEQTETLREFFRRLGIEGKQGAVGFVIDRDYLEIAFPLEAEQEE